MVSPKGRLPSVNFLFTVNSHELSLNVCVAANEIVRSGCFSWAVDPLFTLAVLWCRHFLVQMNPSGALAAISLGKYPNRRQARRHHVFTGYGTILLWMV